ncbi:hypothetical protein EON64_05595 [archaeon]|nr:MAG: hypothetical protein EON64_05595 [archaeon]
MLNLQARTAQDTKEETDGTSSNSGESELQVEGILSVDGNNGEAAQVYTHQSLSYCQPPDMTADPSIDNSSSKFKEPVQREELGVGKGGRRVVVSPVAVEEDSAEDTKAEKLREDIREQLGQDTSASLAPKFTASLYFIEHLGGKRGEKRFVSPSPQAHSGDGTVPYLSLSHAKRYLSEYKSVLPFLIRPSTNAHSDDSSGMHTATTDAEIQHAYTYVPPIIQPAQHLLDSSKTLSPRIEIFSSTFQGASTAVVEVGGGEHLEITKLPALHVLVIDMLLDRMARDLCLGQSVDCKEYYDAPIV